MLHNTLHRPRLRLVVAVLGELLMAAALNLFIVPLGLYTGGLMGVCQLLRTLAQTWLGLDFGTHDIAGILYYIANIPILLAAYKTLGRTFVIKTLICTTAYSIFYSVIPVPAVPIVADQLTGCLLGGILSGVGSGLVLTCGASGGGLDIVGLCLSKRGSNFTVGKFSLSFNAVLYSICLILFSAEVAIYSVIYNFFANMVIDRVHQQNVSVQALIFTRADEKAISSYIIEALRRSVTYWEGIGAYSGDGMHVLCTCVSKYEIEELVRAVHKLDPHAFITTQEGTRIYGNFQRKVG